MAITINNFDADPFGGGSVSYSDHSSIKEFAVDVVPSGETLLAVYVFVKSGLENFDVQELAFNAVDPTTPIFESGYFTGSALGDALAPFGSFTPFVGTFETDGARIIVPPRFGGWAGNASDGFTSHSFDVLVVAVGSSGTYETATQTFSGANVVDHALIIDGVSPAFESTLATNDPVAFSMHAGASKTNFFIGINIGAFIKGTRWETVFGPNGVSFEPKFPVGYQFAEGWQAGSSITEQTDGDGNKYYDFVVVPDAGWKGPTLLVPNAASASGEWTTNETMHWDAPVLDDCVCPPTVVLPLVNPSDYFGTGVDSVALGKAAPVGRDFAQDINTGEMVLIDGDWAFVTEYPAIRQEITQRLKFFLNEWFLDRTAGLPYFQKILGKGFKIDELRNIYRSEIEKVPGVRAVLKLELSLNPATRELSISFTADTDLGELTLSNLLLLTNDVG